MFVSHIDFLSEAISRMTSKITASNAITTLGIFPPDSAPHFHPPPCYTVFLFERTDQCKEHRLRDSWLLSC